jgi:hypothetical protein
MNSIRNGLLRGAGVKPKLLTGYKQGRGLRPTHLKPPFSPLAGLSECKFDSEEIGITQASRRIPARPFDLSSTIIDE